MKTLLILLMISISTSTSTFCQVKHGPRILIRATTSVNGNDYFIDIREQKESIKIIYKFRDSIRQTVNEDAGLIKLTKQFSTIKNLNSSNDSVTSITKQLDSINQSYAAYSTDSLTLSIVEASSFDRLINKVLTSSTETLENKETNKHRIILDGTLMKFMLSSGGINQFAFVHTPSSESHPLLYSLIIEALDLYRQHKGKINLSKQRTSGY